MFRCEDTGGHGIDEAPSAEGALGGFHPDVLAGPVDTFDFRVQRHINIAAPLSNEFAVAALGVVIDVFLDTNILLYALDESSGSREKSGIARRILQEMNWGWSIQVAQEFYVNATRPRKGIAISHDDAENFIKVWMSFPMAVNNVPCLLEALHIKQRYQLSLWDANIIAAARQLRCT